MIWGAAHWLILKLFGTEHEMTMRESLELGSDIVLASSDKLIGGPQGGLIIGSKDLIGRIRKHPLYRALRVGKMTLAALEATLRLFLEPDLLEDNHPVYSMIAKKPEEMREQADILAKRISGSCKELKVSVIEDESRIGGGSLPGTVLPSFAVSITSATASSEEIATALRLAVVPVISYISDGAVRLSMRTVSAREVDDIAAALMRIS